ncbi:hypothetical protein Tco_1002017 [Tanacetum coccineum]|uniref:Uncharacterized protein n=1 Tax=Tanacetum coccineum TaxID=301880 RepID=A0ABQ5F5N8_9ASTR
MGNSKKRVTKDSSKTFHGMDDAKEIWAAIKTRFGGNANSKKMQKAVLKQQFEAFTISSKESLEKGYDRFQKLLSQLDALGAGVSDEDANHKFLRSLPPAWDSLAMTMRTKKNIDTLSIDDLFNNLSVFEQDIQKKSSSSLTSDNVAFLSQAKASSSKHKPSHNSGSYSSYNTSSSKATTPATPGLADEVIHSFLATNADDVDLIHEDLDQIDDLDLEEMDINWQIAMTAIKIKKFYAEGQVEAKWSASLKVHEGRCQIQVGRVQTEDEEIESCSNGFALDAIEKIALKEQKDVFMLRTVNTGRVNVNPGRVNVNTARVSVNTGHGYVNSVSSAGTHIKSGSSRVNTDKQSINSGSVHVNTARVNRPVSNQTFQVNFKSQKKCFSKQSSPVIRPFSRNTAYKSHKYAVKDKVGTAVKTSAGSSTPAYGDIEGIFDSDFVLGT